MAAMSIKKKDPGLAISISLRRNTSRNHLKPMSLEVHPFSEVVYSESGISPCLNQELCTDFPLKLIWQRVRLPIADAASMIETHSRFSGDFLYDLVVEELPTTSWFTDTKGYACLIHIPGVSILHLVFCFNLLALQEWYSEVSGHQS